MLAAVGVNVVDRVCIPTVNTVPATGLYANVPGTLAVAFNCVPPSNVPWTTDAGLAHVIVGVALVTSIVTVAVVPV